MNAPHLLSATRARLALSIRDLTDPAEGPHAMQRLVSEAEDALARAWGVRVVRHRAHPVVSIEDNYDHLGYPPDGPARDARYTRYVSTTQLLRSHTSAMIPALLRATAREGTSGDRLLSCPGIVYRRDAIDRLHSGEPHQLDLWRLCRGKPLGEADLEAMIAQVLAAVLPDVEHRTLPAVHPYTLAGRQIDVAREGCWIEIGECGLAHPAVLARAGLGPDWSGLAMGLGLDRLLMLRKGLDDIRLLRATDPRIAGQLLDLLPYRPVSSQPAIVRDMSIAVAAELGAEELGDRVRAALGADATAIEAVEVRAETAYEELPRQAIERMGMRPGQKNALVRVTLRDLERSLTSDEANRLRDRIYAAIHEGAASEWARRLERCP